MRTEKRLISTNAVIFIALFSLSVVVSCGGDEGPASPGDMPDIDTPDADTPDDTPDGDTPAPTDAAMQELLYSQTTVHTFSVQIAPADWVELISLHDTTAGSADPDQAALVKEIYFPIKFSALGDEPVDAAIRLRANPMHWQAGGKMQLVIRFNKYDNKGRWIGLRGLHLDANPKEPAMMRDRLVHPIFRAAGMVAVRVNHVRLEVNGTYYGVFQNIERIDAGFLDRHFGDYGDGNLYKDGLSLKTNEEENNTSDLTGLQDFVAAEPEPPAADFPTRVAAHIDVDQWLRHLAVEALVAAENNLLVGDHNYYFYRHPTRGFIILPWDLDSSYLSPEQGLFPPERDWAEESQRKLIRLLLTHPQTRATYLQHVRQIRMDLFDSTVLASTVTTYADQLRVPIQNDENIVFSAQEFEVAVTELQSIIEAHLRVIDDELQTLPGN